MADDQSTMSRVNRIVSGGLVALFCALIFGALTVFGFINNTKTFDLDQRYSTLYPSDFCDIYCKSAYDDVWLAALATVQAGAYNGTAIQAVMRTVAANYFGVTGPTLLESSGDRVATTYEIWKVVTQSSAQTWVYAGSWEAATDAVTWTSPP